MQTISGSLSQRNRRKYAKSPKYVATIPKKEHLGNVPKNGQ